MDRNTSDASIESCDKTNELPHQTNSLAGGGIAVTVAKSVTKYSSTTLERERIQIRTIVSIIFTHSHTDHDAGAFHQQLQLTLPPQRLRQHQLQQQLLQIMFIR